MPIRGLALAIPIFLLAVAGCADDLVSRDSRSTTTGASVAGSVSNPSTLQVAADPVRPTTVATTLEARERAERLIKALKDAEAATGFRRAEFDSHGKVVAILLYSAMGTDENVRLLTCFADLARVKISCPRSEMTPGAIAKLGDLKHLEELDLRYVGPTISKDFGLAIAQIKTLRGLTITSSSVDSAALAPLETIPRLQTLKILWTKHFTDADAMKLVGITALEELDLSGTGVTDACLDRLAMMPNLKRLKLSNTAATWAGVTRSGLVSRVDVAGVPRN